MNLDYVVDGWSWAHLAGWQLAGYLGALAYPKWRRIAFLGLLGGLLWEVLELMVVEPWLGFHEPALNRWCCDPLIDLLGAGVGAYFGAWVTISAKRVDR